MSSTIKLLWSEAWTFLASCSFNRGENIWSSWEVFVRTVASFSRSLSSIFRFRKKMESFWQRSNRHSSATWLIFFLSLFYLSTKASASGDFGTASKTKKYTAKIFSEGIRPSSTFTSMSSISLMKFLMVWSPITQQEVSWFLTSFWNS